MACDVLAKAPVEYTANEQAISKTLAARMACEKCLVVIIAVSPP